MKIKLLGLFGALFLAGCSAAFAAPAADLSGNWLGTVEAGGAKLRLVFKVTGSAGSYKASMDSLDQGVRDVKVDSVQLDKNTLRLVLREASASFEGQLDAGLSKATGFWNQGPTKLPLVLTKVNGPINAAPIPENLGPAELAASKQAVAKLSGFWMGSLHTPNASLRLRITITNTPAGAATGLMDSIDQNVTGIPIYGIGLTNDAVSFEARGWAASYSGKLSSAGDSMKGTWRQAGQSMPLELKKSAPGKP